MNVNDVYHQIDDQNVEIHQNLLNEPEKYISEAQRNADLAERNDYSYGRAEAFLNIGACYLILCNPDAAIPHLEQALDLFRLDSDRRSLHGEMAARNELGRAEFSKGNYESSLNQYFISLTQSEMHQDIDIQAQTLNAIGDIHRMINNTEEALRYFHQAQNVAAFVENPVLKAEITINLGKSALDSNDMESAKEYFQSVLDSNELSDFGIITASAMLGSARVQIHRNKLQDAENKLENALKLFSDIGHDFGKAECFYRIGEIKIIRQDFDKALNFIDEAESIAVKQNLQDLLRRCMKRRAHISRHLGDFKKAYEYFLRFYEFEQIQKNDGLKNRLRKISILYETEHTETEKESYRMRFLEMERSNKEIKIINRIGREITSSLDPEEILHRTYESLGEFLEMTSFGIALLDRKENNLTMKFFIENGKRMQPLILKMDDKTSLSVWCITNEKPVLFSTTAETGKYLKNWRNRFNVEINSAIFLPILHGREILGCLTVQSTFEHSYTEANLNLLGAVASFIAVALDNSKAHTELNMLNKIVTDEKVNLEIAYRRISHMANHDALTDLPNRHLLRELIKNGIKMADRDSTKLAVLYMDLDSFKQVNDTLGHDAGDELLKTVSQRIKNALRTSDTVARIGGDEFIAVIYNIGTVENVRSVAEKIIETVHSDIILKDIKYNVGTSIGASIYPDDEVNMEELIRKADAAMYAAKNSGKNRTVFHSDSPAEISNV